MTHAIRIHAPGGPEVMHWEDVPTPEPGPAEALVHHTAVGLNYIDVYFRNGLYKVPSLPATLGMEAAGVVRAVGVALAAGLTGKNGYVLRATVLVVVVLTVIIFGGTTARMLEILGIRTGVVEEIDSDDEFDIEVVANGTYARKSGTGFGHTPRPSAAANGTAFALDTVGGFRSGGGAGIEQRTAKYSSGHTSPPDRPTGLAPRRNSSRLAVQDAAEQGLLSPSESPSYDPEDDDLDLPPQARRSPVRAASPPAAYPTSGSTHPDGRAGGGHPEQSRVAAATGAITQLISGLSEDPAGAFRQIDEGFIKPHLLLDPKGGHGPGQA